MPLNEGQATILRNMIMDTKTVMKDDVTVTSEEVETFISSYGQTMGAEVRDTVSKVALAIKDMMMVDPISAEALKDAIPDVYLMMKTEKEFLQDLASPTSQEVTRLRVSRSQKSDAESRLGRIRARKEELERDRMAMVNPSAVLAMHQERMVIERGERDTELRLDTDEMMSRLSHSMRQDPRAVEAAAHRDLHALYALYCEENGITMDDLESELPCVTDANFDVTGEKCEQYKSVLQERLTRSHPLSRISMHNALERFAGYTHVDGKGGYYAPADRKINLHSSKELTDERGCGGTFYHEMSHMVDDLGLHRGFGRFSDAAVREFEANAAALMHPSTEEMFQRRLTAAQTALSQSGNDPQKVSDAEEKIRTAQEKIALRTQFIAEWTAFSGMRSTLNPEQIGAKLKIMGAKYHDISFDVNSDHYKTGDAMTGKEPDLTEFTGRMWADYHNYITKFSAPALGSGNTAQDRKLVADAVKNRLYQDIVVRAQYAKDHDEDLAPFGGSVEAAAEKMSRVYKDLMGKSLSDQRSWLKKTDPLVWHFFGGNRYQHCSGITDIFGSFAKFETTPESKELRTGIIYGHAKDYWERGEDKNRASEAWAEMNECEMGGSREQILFYREFMPESYKYFLSMRRRMK